MAKKFYVLKPFKYQGKMYQRGDEFDAEGLGLPSLRIEIREKARIIIEESKLTPAEKAKLLQYRNISKKETPKQEEPVVVEEPVVENKPITNEPPTLFNSPSVGGKRKNKNYQ